MKNRYSFERLFEKHSEGKLLCILKSNISSSRAWKIVK